MTKRFEYHCPTHGAFEDELRSDVLFCPKCQERSKRVWGSGVRINTYGLS